MDGEKKAPKYSSIIIKKLFLISIRIFLLYLFILIIADLFMSFLVHNQVFVVTICGLMLALLIALTPFLSFLLFYARKKTDNNFIDKLGHCKYNPMFPFYFYINSHKRTGERINIDEITPLLNDCDIIVRRYDNYLDGLIFSQHSFFTHVGLVYKDDRNDFHVYHSEGKEGVHSTELKNFLVCDDIAILRFSFSNSQDELNIRRYIIEDTRATNKEPDLSNSELRVFDEVTQIFASNETDVKVQHDKKFIDEYSKIILERARSLIGSGYDFEFDFNNFERFSCIEFVWYCFKCLFPIHQIKVRDFEYFGMFRLPVIIPDIFIQNNHFRLVTTSLPEISTKRQLKDKIRKGSWQLHSFLLVMLVWEIIAFCICFLVMWFMLK